MIILRLKIEQKIFIIGMYSSLDYGNWKEISYNINYIIISYNINYIIRYFFCNGNFLSVMEIWRRDTVAKLVFTTL